PTARIASPFTTTPPFSRMRRSGSMVTTVPPAITKSAGSLFSCATAEAAQRAAPATRTQKQQTCLFIEIAPSLGTERISEAGTVKGFGKEIAHLQHFHLALEVGKDDGDVAAKFPDELAASATGRRELVGVGYD